MLSQEILVGGDNGLTLAQCGAQELKRVARPTHRFYNYINVWIPEELLPVSDRRSALWSVLALNVATPTDRSHLKTDTAALLDQIGMFRDDVGRGTSYSSKPNDAGSHSLHRLLKTPRTKFAC
jgi:hypothetical protein